jgi:hypothetical protein
MAGVLEAIGTAVGGTGAGTAGAATAGAGKGLWKGVAGGLSQMGKGFLSGVGRASPIMGKILPAAEGAAKDVLIKSPSGSIPPLAGEGLMGKLGQIAGSYAGSRMSNPYINMISDFFGSKDKSKIDEIIRRYGGQR